MRCLLCERWSWSLVCTKCQRELLRPTIKKRTLFSDFSVYSFYHYSEIEELLLSKHTPVGAAIYKILAKNSMKIFAQTLELEAFLIPIDDHIRYGYSHSAILAKQMQTKHLKAYFASMRARNRVHYSGKSLDFRLKHPRDFCYKGPQGDIILIDDIITTGTTLKEAYLVAKKAGANPLFALTLADARE